MYEWNKSSLLVLLTFCVRAHTNMQTHSHFSDAVLCIPVGSPHLMITCVYVSHVRTTWSASAFCASHSSLPLSPSPIHAVPAHPSHNRAALPLALPDSQEITARLKLTCVTQTPAWMEECALAEKEAIPASAERITQVRVCCVFQEEMCYCVFLDDGNSCEGLAKRTSGALCSLLWPRIAHLWLVHTAKTPGQHFKCVLKVGCWMYSRMMKINTVMSMLPQHTPTDRFYTLIQQIRCLLCG